ncbi:MAG: LacI family DNA-binding transcriptional regulator [Cyclobacteriaceae bacterium]
MARITIKQIAEKAQVSVGTVDRVLHNRGDVSAKTRELVLKIAKEGHYTTNVFARSLKLSGKIRIAVILPQDNEYWLTQKQGITSAAEQYSTLGMKVDFFAFDRHNDDSFVKQSSIALESNPQGIIMAPLLPFQAREICHRIEARKVPYVFVDSNLTGVNPLSFIGQDSEQSGFLAAKLLNLGHENGHRSMIIRFTDFDSLNKTLDERIAGFRKYYQEKSFDSSLIEEIVLDKNFKGLHPSLAEHYERQESIHLFIPNSRAHQVARDVIAHGRKDLSRILGYDLVNDNVACLNDDSIDFIIHQNPHVQGTLAIEALYKKMILNTEVPAKRYMQLDIITKENLMYGV